MASIVLLLLSISLRFPCGFYCIASIVYFFLVSLWLLLHWLLVLAVGIGCVSGVVLAVVLSVFISWGISCGISCGIDSVIRYGISCGISG